MTKPTATTDPPPVLRTPNGVDWIRRDTTKGFRYAAEGAASDCPLAVMETALTLISEYGAVDPAGGEGRELTPAGRVALEVIIGQPTAEQAVLALETAGLLTLPATADDIRQAVREQVLAEIAATLTVHYRAKCHGIPLGTYSNQEAAKAHCEAHMRTVEPQITDLSWIGEEDFEDGDPIELYVTLAGAELVTGCTVTRVEVATEYDSATQDFTATYLVDGGVEQ